MSVQEIISVLKVKKAIIYRKIALLEALSDAVVAYLIDLHDEKQIELMSFRFLCKVSEAKEGYQMKIIKEKLKTLEKM